MSKTALNQQGLVTKSSLKYSGMRGKDSKVWLGRQYRMVQELPVMKMKVMLVIIGMSANYDGTRALFTCYL
jgi:hypothetical protein